MPLPQLASTGKALDCRTGKLSPLMNNFLKWTCLGMSECESYNFMTGQCHVFHVWPFQGLKAWRISTPSSMESLSRVFQDWEALPLSTVILPSIGQSLEAEPLSP